jgi:hypothetical protein
MPPQQPERTTNQPFASVLKGDMAGVVASGGTGTAARTPVGQEKNEVQTISGKSWNVVLLLYPRADLPSAN